MKLSKVKEERGIALISVLWITILLSTLATALVAMSRSDARQLIAENNRLQTSEAAQAAINLALLSLSDPKGYWAAKQTSTTYNFAETTIAVTIEPESGKIDLNMADSELITGLLAVVGASAGQAQKIADNIKARRASSARRAPFESVGELLEVPGMTRELFDRAAPNLTLYSGFPSVDTHLASPDVLLAIPGNTRADVDAAILSRSLLVQSANSVSDLSKIVGQAFTIDALARSTDGYIVHRTEVVRLTDDPRQPVWVLSTQVY